MVYYTIRGDYNMKEKLYFYKKKIIIIGTILILVIGVNIGYGQWNSYKYKTGFGLTNTEKSQNIKIAVLGKRYDKALELSNNYYEDNDSIRLQWKSKIETCKDQGLNARNVAELDNIY
jgi:hypothetical protein